MVFFYGYDCEGYYENNVDGCFTNISGYKDNGTARSRLLMTNIETGYYLILKKV